MKETQYYQSGNQTSNLNAVRSKAVVNASIARSIEKDLRVSAYNLNPKLCANILSMISHADTFQISIYQSMIYI